MRWFLQLALVRIAAAFWSLALRLGRDKPSSGENAFEMSARRALADAETRPPRRARVSDHPEPPEGYAHMSPQAQLAANFASSLLLVDADRRTFIPIFVGPTEAAAFQHRLEGKRFPRPLPYDLFESLAMEAGALVGSARIDSIRDNVFIATLVLVFGDERIVELDARASDAIVIAMGCGAPVVVSEEVIRQAGRPLMELESQVLEGAQGTP